MTKTFWSHKLCDENLLIESSMSTICISWKVVQRNNLTRTTSIRMLVIKQQDPRVVPVELSIWPMKLTFTFVKPSLRKRFLSIFNLTSMWCLSFFHLMVSQIFSRNLTLNWVVRKTNVVGIVVSVWASIIAHRSSWLCSCGSIIFSLVGRWFSTEISVASWCPKSKSASHNSGP